MIAKLKLKGIDRRAPPEVDSFFFFFVEAEQFINSSFTLISSFYIAR